MESKRKQKNACANRCPRCETPFSPGDQRILSVYDHQAICMECKNKEVHASNYQQFSKSMIKQCMLNTELTMADPGDYCYHHFYPYRI
jgi:hypothetical protein